jgi:hypothetical protein
MSFRRLMSQIVLAVDGFMNGMSARCAERARLLACSLRLLPLCVRLTAEGQALCAQQVLDGVRDFGR